MQEIVTGFGSLSLSLLVKASLKSDRFWKERSSVAV